MLVNDNLFLFRRKYLKIIEKPVVANKMRSHGLGEKAWSGSHSILLWFLVLLLTVDMTLTKLYNLSRPRCPSFLRFSSVLLHCDHRMLMLQAIHWLQIKILTLSFNIIGVFCKENLLICGSLLIGYKIQITNISRTECSGASLLNWVKCRFLETFENVGLGFWLSQRENCYCQLLCGSR